MQGTRRLLARLWSDERGIAAVEYALLLAMISGGIIIGLDLLSGAVSGQMAETALWFGGDGGDACGNSGDGDGTGDGSGQGSENTC